MKFRFHTGREIVCGDRVFLAGEPGKIEAVLLPNTKEAEEFGCTETGGIVAIFPEGLGLVLITDPENDEDLDFNTNG